MFSSKITATFTIHCRTLSTKDTSQPENPNLHWLKAALSRLDKVSFVHKNTGNANHVKTC